MGDFPKYGWENLAEMSKSVAGPIIFRDTLRILL